jgi:hypothetical protein
MRSTITITAFSIPALGKPENCPETGRSIPLIGGRHPPTLSVPVVAF